jgi:hypothetical protein
MYATITALDEQGRQLPYWHYRLSGVESALCYLDQFWDLPLGTATFIIAARGETKTYDFGDSKVLRYLELDWENATRS